MSKQGAYGKPSTPALAIATAASGEPNPNVLSAEGAEHLQKRKDSLTKKNIIATLAGARRLTQAHQAIIELEAENKAAREAREKAKHEEIEKAAAAAAAADSLLTEVAKAAENRGGSRSPTHSQTHKHDGLRMLAQSEGLFVESAGPEFEQIFELDLKHKYVILNSLAERVFFASETLEEYCEAFSKHREVDMTAFAGYGGLLFEIGGSTRDAKVAIRHSNDVLEFVGTVRKHRFSSTYSIYDQEMKEVFRLVRSRKAEREEVDDVYIPTTTLNPDDEQEEEEEEDESSRPLRGRDYKLYTAEDGFDEVIGELNSHHVLKERLRTHHCYGVTFPNSLEINSKILICSALLILNFLFFEKFEVGNRRSQACAGILFSLMVVVIVIILCAIVVFCIVYKDIFPKRKSTELGPPPCDMAF